MRLSRPRGRASASASDRASGGPSGRWPWPECESPRSERSGGWKRKCIRIESGGTPREGSMKLAAFTQRESARRQPSCRSSRNPTSCSGCHERRRMPQRRCSDTPSAKDPLSGVRVSRRVLPYWHGPSRSPSASLTPRWRSGVVSPTSTQPGTYRTATLGLQSASIPLREAEYCPLPPDVTLRSLKPNACHSYRVCLRPP